MPKYKINPPFATRIKFSISFFAVKMQLSVSQSLNMFQSLLIGSKQQIQQFFSLNIFFMQNHHNEYQALSSYIYPFTYPSISSVRSLSCVRIFATPWTAAQQVSLSITNSWNLLTFMSIESVMPPNHFILCCPLLLLPPILSSIGVFSKESVLHIKWPKYISFTLSSDFIILFILLMKI